ncbi:MAG: calcium/sodium antiporter [Hyphomicrobiales bacterium]|nr:calcium/sodium antiporter [Hyphomicrobiales bacterium]
MDYLLLATGLALLVFAGDMLVRGSVSLAEKIGIPSMIIGLTIVAFGTSAPELVVSMKAAVDGFPGIAVGNVIGSNIANVLFVLGVAAVLSSVDCNQPYVRRNAIFMIAATFVFIYFCSLGTLQAWHGLVLLAMLAVYLIETARGAIACKNAIGGRDCDELEGIETIECVPHNPLTVAMFIGVGLVGLPLAAQLTVEGASGVAKSWGVSDAVIGLTIVAIGTTLPELATTVMAAVRREAALAIGNILGSNLFNLLAIMGLTAVVVPVPIAARFMELDLWVMLAASLIIMPFIFARSSMGRTVAVTFLVAYIAYINVLFEPSMVGLGVAAVR